MLFRSLSRLPDVLFVVDVFREATSIHEANLLHIPVVAMVDTNCDPRNVDYIIPSNDDAIRAIKLIVGKIADAAVEGKALRKDIEIEQPAAVGMMEETELSDEELLGESTLAKLSSQARTITISADDEEVVVEGLLEVEPDTTSEEGLVVASEEEPETTSQEELDSPSEEEPEASRGEE